MSNAENETFYYFLKNVEFDSSNMFKKSWDKEEEETKGWKSMCYQKETPEGN